jgi:hypothetical protein
MATTYFGGCDSAGVAAQDSLTDFGSGKTIYPNISTAPAQSFTCPGTAEATQNIISLGAYMKTTDGGPYTIRMALYDSSNAFVTQGSATISVTGTDLAWFESTSFVDQAKSSHSPTILGGHTYKITLTSGDNYALKGGYLTDAANKSLWDTLDYTTGYPATLALTTGQLGVICVRCGVEPAGGGATGLNVYIS